MTRPSNSADTVQVHFCGHCKFPHLVLFNEDGIAFAQAVIDRDIAESIMDAVERSESGEPQPVSRNLFE